VVRTFAKFRPFTIDVDPGGVRSLDSLLFANIDEMAKYATLSEDSRPDDGRFEVIAVPHTAKWRILGVALKAATRGLGPQPTARHFRFTTVKPTPMQLDGEVIAVEAATPVSVDIAAGALATIG
jgi:diacylglycerol kinase family enzyme